MNKIILYELNEVSWQVVNFYLSKRKDTYLEQLIKSSHKFTSMTYDSGELHPWSTWPTVHRGVSNDLHNIRFINQDLSYSNQYPPIWEILNKNKKTSGIFGSLQSGLPKDNQHMLFHIPDTFAKDYNTFPKKYKTFQKINLKQTNKNKAISSRVTIFDFIEAIPLISNGLSFQTIFKIINHLAIEKINPYNKSLRPTLQAHLSFDVFKSCLNNHKPDFISFFTNHVAGIMHRYWKFSFPNEFNYKLSDSKKDQFHKNSIIKAMDIADRHIGFLIKFSKKYNYDLVVCSSMGQEAIDRGDYQAEIQINNFRKLKESLDYNSSIKINMAMQPDIAFEFENKEDLNYFLKKITSIKTKDDKQIFYTDYKPIGLTLNIKSIKSNSLEQDQIAIYNSKEFPLNFFGIQTFKRDIGTGYHKPEGIIIWQNNKKYSKKKINKVDSRRIAPTILKNFNLNIPEYMQKPLPIDI